MKDLDVKLEAILRKHKEIEEKLSKQDKIDTNKLIRLNKEYSELTPLVDSVLKFRKCPLGEISRTVDSGTSNCEIGWTVDH